MNNIFEFYIVVFICNEIIKIEIRRFVCKWMPELCATFDFLLNFPNARFIVKAEFSNCIVAASRSDWIKID